MTFFIIIIILSQKTICMPAFCKNQLTLQNASNNLFSQRFGFGNIPIFVWKIFFVCYNDCLSIINSSRCTHNMNIYIKANIAKY